MNDTASGMTGGWRLPPAARILGLAGLLPFFGLSVLSIAGQDWARFPLLAYGAVILSFLGAVHWGAALRGPESEAGWDWPRLVLGVVPSLLAWGALSWPEPRIGALVLALGILATAAAESRVVRLGAVGPGWSRLRWVLSVGAAAALFAGGFVWN